jgi:hypothetical protein
VTFFTPHFLEPAEPSSCRFYRLSDIEITLQRVIPQWSDLRVLRLAQCAHALCSAIAGLRLPREWGQIPRPGVIQNILGKRDIYHGSAPRYRPSVSL